MPTYQVFVDGAVGTTGLRIHQRLSQRQDITLITLPEAQRKHLPARLQAVQQADVSILCLPDAAAKDIVQAAPATARLCDTSTAHRTNPNWLYGFPELAHRRKTLATATRVAVPGCHATGFISLITPLVQAGALPTNAPLSCHSVTGYSGGGKSMIAAYENENRPANYAAPRLYALGMQHKHLPEMAAVTGLQTPPLFCPMVANYYSGMLVTVPLPASLLASSFQTPAAVSTLLQAYYANEALVAVHPAGHTPPDGTLSAGAASGLDTLEIFVCGTRQHILLCARFDNLGKGASGAAIQCVNLMLGLPETSGLCLHHS